MRYRLAQKEFSIVLLISFEAQTYTQAAAATTLYKSKKEKAAGTEVISEWEENI